MESYELVDKNLFDVNLQNTDGKTALYYALENKNYEIAAKIINNPEFDLEQHREGLKTLLPQNTEQNTDITKENLLEKLIYKDLKKQTVENTDPAFANNMSFLGEKQLTDLSTAIAKTLQRSDRKSIKDVQFLAATLANTHRHHSSHMQYPPEQTAIDDNAHFMSKDKAEQKKYRKLATNLLRMYSKDFTGKERWFRGTDIKTKEGAKDNLADINNSVRNARKNLEKSASKQKTGFFSRVCSKNQDKQR